MNRIRPEFVVMGSYLSAILIGAILLSLPFASSSGEPIYLVDALFTATSAICVTGLTVIDTGSGFSLFGQIVILILVQLGGLGIMTFSILLFLSVGRGVSRQQRWIIQESFTQMNIPDVKSLMKSIFLFTFVIEAIGVVILFINFSREFVWSKALYFSIFHSVSAFCNAGFGLFSDSLVGYQGNWLVNLTVVGLVVLGGIGFFVLYELSRVKTLAKKRWNLSLHAKIVIFTSLVLILLAGVTFFVMEQNSTLKELSFPDKILTSLFQAVTPRTAGFSTVNFGLLSNTTLLLFMIFMFVGASPGSCGGGIKTTSLAVMASLLWNRMQGRSSINIFKRTIPNNLATKVIAIAFLGGLLIFVITCLLMITQLGGLSYQQSRGYFLKYLFETVSAFGTVGLSMGITSHLNSLGKLLLIITMYLGRVGLLTFAYGVAGREATQRWQYAEEKVMIG